MTEAEYTQQSIDRYVEQVRTLVNDFVTGHSQMPEGTFQRFVALARLRAQMEIPYRAAALFAISRGDFDFAHELYSNLPEDLGRARAAALQAEDAADPPQARADSICGVFLPATGMGCSLPTSHPGECSFDRPRAETK